MKGKTIWLTGLPCSGKTTLANALKEKIHAEHLDGDEMRKIISRDLGFSKEDREKHLERIAYIASLLNRNGVDVIASFVSPYEKTRNKIKEIIESNGGKFILVYLKCSLDTCIKRDVKGMYKKALNGEIKNFTGIDDPYEEPENPDIVVDTEKESVDDGVNKILDYLDQFKDTYSLYIGRWQPFHNGHKALIEHALKKGEKVVIAIRDTKRDEKNPFTIKEREMMIKAVMGDKVKIIHIPDINKVYIGREVGYELIQLGKEMEEISATKVRQGNLDLVPEEVREYLSKKGLNEEKR